MSDETTAQKWQRLVERSRAMWGTQGCPERGWWREKEGHKRLARPLAISDERRRLIAPFLVADTCGQIQLCHSTKSHDESATLCMHLTIRTKSPECPLSLSHYSLNFTKSSYARSSLPFCARSTSLRATTSTLSARYASQRSCASGAQTPNFSSNTWYSESTNPCRR